MLSSIARYAPINVKSNARLFHLSGWEFKHEESCGMCAIRRNRVWFNVGMRRRRFRRERTGGTTTRCRERASDPEIRFRRYRYLRREAHVHN
jgi:hypothetical protein